MSIIINKINNFLKDKNLSYCKLAKLIDEHDSTLIAMIKSKRPFSKKVINKLLPILEVSREEFESWILADKYPKEILERAIKVRKAFLYKRKSILTVNIDKILAEKQMSRTALAKQIKYSQSGVNRMIIGQIAMSKSVIERISNALEIPRDEILSWILADKYSLEVLQKSCHYAV